MKRFQILSLDGGGIRGLYSAAVLAKFEEKHSVNITQHFDLITGTSTGGIIALGLGMGMRCHEIVDFYLNAGPKIFSNPFWWKNLSRYFCRKYSTRPLQAALINAFGERKMGESACRLVIPSYDLEHGKVRIFKTPHHERLKTDWKIPAWKIGLATSAAPTYFSACRQINHSRLIDGGIWANNPAVIGITEAVSMLGCQLSDIHVLSLGTTTARLKQPAYLNSAGNLPWVWGSRIIDVLMNGQSVGTSGLAEHLIGKQNFFRADTIVPKIIPLDALHKEQFLTHAEDSALHQGPEIENRFFKHAAAPYTPIYSDKQEEKNDRQQRIG